MNKEVMKIVGKLEVMKIVGKLEDGTADSLDVIRLCELAKEGDLYASLEYGICLYLGEQIEPSINEATNYFIEALKSDDFGVLVELVSFMEYVDPILFEDLINQGHKKIYEKMKAKGQEIGIDIDNLN